MCGGGVMTMLAAGALVLALAQTASALGTHAAKRHGRRAVSYGQMYRHDGCAPLDNRGTHFTVDVEVGTPGQRFSVVADTGSNTLIVPSCVCRERGQCPRDGSEHCFTGTGRSSSFQLERDASGPSSLVLTFGSGQIKGIVAKERVKVGQVEAFLDDGLLLMTDRALNIQGAFEGILGLGVPQTPEGEQQQQEAGPAGYADRMAEAAARAGGEQPPGDHQRMPANLQDIIQKIMGQAAGRLPAGEAQPALQPRAVEIIPLPRGVSPEDYMRQVVGAMNISGGGMVSASIGSALVASADSLASAAARGALAGQNPLEDLLKKIIASQGGAVPLGAGPPQRSSPKGFLEQAKVDRFSVCFNDGSGGVLSLGGEMPKASHGGIGKQHWGVDFRGISVGNETLPSQALFCTPETTNMTEEQRTPCGAIPDSGTTAIMGPADQVLKLMEGICDGWDRCRKNYTAMVDAITAAENDMKQIYGFNPFSLRSTVKKTDILQAVLADCELWMDEKAGLSELPPLHFHVQGSNGTKQTLTIPGHLYIMETPRELLQQRAGSAQQQPTYVQLGEAGISALALDGIPATEMVPEINSRGNISGKVCTPAFGAMEYQTRTNGPVWIFGTPLFYQYVVGYDVSTDPPSIAFSDQGETPCGACDPAVRLWARPAEQDLEDEGAWEQALPEQRELHRPLRVDAPPRLPRLDTSQPL
ncbi:unnamed protein product [Prorocentrum cordatum]|uniref:Peptidase A1 domain-containing protein n=1 Tax=Prorocentrum cordatum TaxID=2364126 RepID=A0ABN9S8G5_9DINO|nr:unnamed protein product [Polarella glacialis]